MKPFIGVNLLWLRSGQVGGSQEYLERQLLGLAKLSADLRVVLYVTKGFSGHHQELAAAYECIEAPQHMGNRLARIILEQTWLAIQTRKCNLVHHGGGTVPLFGKRRTLLTVHDVQYLSYPENFGRVRLAYLQVEMPRSVRRATVVTTPSNYVREKLIDSFDVPQSKVVVVRHGVGADLGVDATSQDELRQRFGLGNKEIIFLPAITHPHKNHLFLVQLLATTWKNRDLTLVCAGSKGRAEEELMREVRRNNLDSRVVRISRVSNEDRDGLIQMAKALVFPSLYEGFGAPVLEAMALGTPVIASDRAALPEVIGDGGLVVPLQAQAWAEALDELEVNRDRLVVAGRKRATEFTAEKSGRDLLDAYERAL